MVLAKRMERGNGVLLKAISRSPITVREVIAAGVALRMGTRSIKEIVHFDDDESDDQIENKSNRTERIFCRIEELHTTCLKQAAALEKAARGNLPRYRK